MDGRSPVAAWLAIPRAPHLQNRQLLFLSIAVSLGSFGLYVLYKQDRILEYVEKIQRAFRVGANTYDVVKNLTRVSVTVWDDLRTFVQSDANEVPQSLKQLTKLLATDEFRESTRTMVMTFFEGMALSGGDRTAGSTSGARVEELVERVIVRVTQRPDVWSIAVRLATRNAADELVKIWSVMKSPGLHAGGPGRLRSMNPAAFDAMMSPLASENGRRVVSTVVTAFTTTIATMFVEQARGVETWDEVIRYVSRPNNFRMISQLVGISSREFGQSVVQAVMQPAPPVGRTIHQTIPSVAPNSEITAEVDYAAIDARQRPSHQRTMLPVDQTSPSDALITSLRESFATMTSSQEQRKAFYKFFSWIIVEIIKVLFNDFLDWFKQSVFAKCLLSAGALIFECLLFCSIPFFHSYTTGYVLEYM